MKIYIQPTLLSVELRHAQMLCQSGAKSVTTNLTGEDVINYNNDSYSGPARVKEQNLWDEEW